MANQQPVPERGMAEAIALLKTQIARDDAVIAELRTMVAYLRTISQANITTAQTTEQATPRLLRR